MSVLRGDYIGVDINARFREQLAESLKLGIGLILRAGVSEVRGRLGGDEGAASDGGTSKSAGNGGENRGLRIEIRGNWEG